MIYTGTNNRFRNGEYYLYLNRGEVLLTIYRNSEFYLVKKDYKGRYEILPLGLPDSDYAKIFPIENCHYSYTPGYVENIRSPKLRIINYSELEKSNYYFIFNIGWEFQMIFKSCDGKIKTEFSNVNGTFLPIVPRPQDTSNKYYDVIWTFDPKQLTYIQANNLYEIL